MLCLGGVMGLWLRGEGGITKCFIFSVSSKFKKSVKFTKFKKVLQKSENKKKTKIIKKMLQNKCPQKSITIYIKKKT
jgi:hypothetical protein